MSEKQEIIYLNKPITSAKNDIIGFETYVNKLNAAINADAHRDDMPSRISLSANNEFKSIRNSVLQEALRLKDLEQYPFTEELVEKIYIPPNADLPNLPKRYNLNRINQINTTNIALASTRIFARLTQAFRNDLDCEDEQITPSVDKKLAQEINEKKQAQGLKM